MKISKLILAIWLAASAWAQSPPPKQQPETHAAAKPSGGQVATPSPKTSAPAASGKKTSKAAPRNAKGKPAAPQPAAINAAESRKPAAKGERDPFVSPIVERLRSRASCTGSGRQCLEVDDISLQGVVQYTGGYIAVVTTGEHTYFLHDNDPLEDGDVQRITKDAITLRQRSTDILGRPVVHEVTRKLGAPAV